MFDFDEIEDDVCKKGSNAWAESGKNDDKLREEAAKKAEEVAKKAASAVTKAKASKQAAVRSSSPPAPAPVVRAGPAAAEETEERIGNLCAVVWRPQGSGRDGREQCKPAVVVCAGNPSKALGASHMGAPLILALFDAVAAAGFPALRFDYRGVGRSAEKTGLRIPVPAESCEDALAVAHWALEHISDRIVIAGYSYGTSMSLAVLMADLPSAFLALSCGTEQWRMFEGDPEEVARRKEDQVRHSRVKVPAVYICGEKDWITDQGELNRILSNRADGGTGALVEVIPGVKHELLGQEAAAGKMAAEWLQAWWASETFS